jgi:MYXO-CTERM domain-containing protein
VDGKVGCRLSRLLIPEVLFMKFPVTAGVLLLASTFAHAQTSHWAFSYTGFYDQEAAAFLPDMRIDGSFTGVDANGDGILERGELTSLLVDAKDYVACAAGSNAYYHCDADSFRFSAESGLSFGISEYSSDPEGLYGGGHFVTTGQMAYDYQFDPSASSEHHLLWTDGTALTMSAALPGSESVPAVPEAPTWAMLLAGVAGIGLWRRRRA